MKFMTRALQLMLFLALAPATVARVSAQDGLPPAKADAPLNAPVQQQQDRPAQPAEDPAQPAEEARTSGTA